MSVTVFPIRVTLPAFTRGRPVARSTPAAQFIGT